MELVNEWFPTGKFRKFDTPFRTESTYEKEPMDALPLTGNDLHKANMEYHGKFGHNLGSIQHIALTIIIDICYTVCHLEIQIVESTINGFQGIKRCIKYIAIHQHKPIFYPSDSYNGLNVIILTCSGNTVEYYTTHDCLECQQYADHDRSLNRIR